MLGKVRTINPDLYAQRCVGCGTPTSDEVAREQCGHCGVDLRVRPPRSYAEMEGLVETPFGPEHVPAADRAERFVNHRWLSFLFLVFIGLLLMMYLASAAMP